MNNAAVNVGVQILVQDSVFTPFGFIPGGRMAGSCGVSV